MEEMEIITIYFTHTIDFIIIKFVVKLEEENSLFSARRTKVIWGDVLLQTIRKQICFIFPLTHTVFWLCDNSWKAKTSTEF